MNETRHPRSRGGGVYAVRIHRLGPTFAVTYTYTLPHCRMQGVHTVHAKGKEK